MRTESELTEASRQYSAAYAAHYTDHDLHQALRLYKKIMAAHPSAPEAEYARMQVQNIVNAIVPKQELLDAQLKLVRAHLEDDSLLDVGPMAATPLAAGLPA